MLLDLIIGRDANSQQLRISSADGKINKAVGAAGSVPMNVSRKHAQLTVNDDGSCTIRNLNAANITDGEGHPLDAATVPMTLVDMDGAAGVEADSSGAAATWAGAARACCDSTEPASAARAGVAASAPVRPTVAANVTGMATRATLAVGRRGAAAEGRTMERAPQTDNACVAKPHRD